MYIGKPLTPRTSPKPSTADPFEGFVFGLVSPGVKEKISNIEGNNKRKSECSPEASKKERKIQREEEKRQKKLEKKQELKVRVHGEKNSN